MITCNGSRVLYFSAFTLLIVALLVMNRIYLSRLSEVKVKYVKKLRESQVSQVKVLESKLQSITSVQSPYSFLVESYFFPDHLLPSFVQWHDKTLVCWRSDFKVAKLKYGWFNIYDLKVGSNISESFRYVGIGIKTTEYESLGFVKQEEPRLMVLSDGSLLNMFTGNAHYKLSSIHYYISTYNATTDTIDFGETVWMKYPGKQKNWVPFEHGGVLYFIEQINPLHVVTISHVDTAKAIATISSVVRDKEAVELHWNGTEYGEHIRGGTPAILVQGVLLSFFHTCVRAAPSRTILTYYFGAVTFCNHFPFQIHSISRVPITPHFLYSGPWTHGTLDYVSYPTGIIADKDGKHVWVSLGHQDRDAYVLKMDVQRLYEGMRVVAQCNASNVLGDGSSRPKRDKTVRSLQDQNNSSSSTVENVAPVNATDRPAIAI